MEPNRSPSLQFGKGYRVELAEDGSWHAEQETTKLVRSGRKPDVILCMSFGSELGQGYLGVFRHVCYPNCSILITHVAVIIEVVQRVKTVYWFIVIFAMTKWT